MGSVDLRGGDKWITVSRDQIFVQRQGSKLWSAVRPGGVNDSWESLRFESSSFGIAGSSSRGGLSLALTEDSGRTWKPIRLTSSLGQVEICDLLALSRTNWIVAGQVWSGWPTAVALETRDGGKTWTTWSFANILGPFLRIVRSGEARIVLIASDMVIPINLRTQKQESGLSFRGDKPMTLWSGSQSGVDLFVVGGWNGFYRFAGGSSLGASLVEDDPRFADPVWFSGVAFCDGKGLAIGALGNILGSFDGGATWRPETKVEAGILRDVTCEGSNFLVVGDQGYVARIRLTKE